MRLGGIRNATPSDFVRAESSHAGQRGGDDFIREGRLLVG